MHTLIGYSETKLNLPYFDLLAIVKEISNCLAVNNFPRQIHWDSSIIVIHFRNGPVFGGFKCQYDGGQ